MLRIMSSHWTDEGLSPSTCLIPSLAFMNGRQPTQLTVDCVYCDLNWIKNQNTTPKFPTQQAWAPNQREFWGKRNNAAWRYEVPGRTAWSKLLESGDHGRGLSAPLRQHRAGEERRWTVLKAQRDQTQGFFWQTPYPCCSESVRSQSPIQALIKGSLNSSRISVSEQGSSDMRLHCLRAPAVKRSVKPAHWGKILTDLYRQEPLWSGATLIHKDKQNKGSAFTQLPDIHLNTLWVLTGHGMCKTQYPDTNIQDSNRDFSAWLAKANIQSISWGC